VAGGNGHLLGEAKVHTGRIVSGDNFVSDPLLRAKIIQDYAPLCVEMEGAAIGHAAFLNSVPFAVIRSIPDNGDEFSELTYAQFEEHAAKLSPAIVLDMLLSITLRWL
jgi:adenosylhomocysteine nucleosidase